MFAERPRSFERDEGATAPAFDGFFIGGFECSEQRLESGRRLSLLESTRHEELADRDYVLLRGAGMSVCREGAAWVRSERRPGIYDFSSAARRLAAARRQGVRIIWDLMHFGWPDDVDVFSAAFPGRLARFAGAFARFLADSGVTRPMLAPINEISFLSWAGGDARCLNPFQVRRGAELKVQLVRASIEAIEAVRAVSPDARFLQPEPLVNFIPDGDDAASRERAAIENLGQFEAWDMLSGRSWPGLGGKPSYLDVLGINFYEHNQFTVSRQTVWRGDARYRPFSSMLAAVWARYGCPMLISETGSEGEQRAEWLRYVGGQVCEALDAGCAIHGLTLYPILNHPGWVDDRHCHNGLWDYADAHGVRPVHTPLLAEMERLAPTLEAAHARMLARAVSAAQ